MSGNGLYKKLKDAYTEENLTTISSQLIKLYKERQYDTITAIARKIKMVVDIGESRINRIFSKLIMLYHPDKLNLYVQEIEKLNKEGKLEELCRFSHILILLNNEEDVFDAPIMDLDDLLPEGQKWGYDEEDLLYFTDLETSEMFDGEEPDYPGETKTMSKDFFSAVKRREYGSLQNDLQYHHLEELHGKLNMADYEIDDLTGVEYCKNISSLDLSDNSIMDITKLYFLKQITELYLSNNNIDEIGILYKLGRLNILDLSGNQIDDIRPLYHLDNLEYLNIEGNKVPKEQISKLSDQGVVVVF